MEELLACFAGLERWHVLGYCTWPWKLGGKRRIHANAEELFTGVLMADRGESKTHSCLFHARCVVEDIIGDIREPANGLLVAFRTTRASESHKV
jgi:hypothetical protein